MTPNSAESVAREIADQIAIRLKWDQYFSIGPTVVEVCRNALTTYAAQQVQEYQEQIHRLADFILTEIPGEPSQSQGAVDTAIRLLHTQKQQVREAERQVWADMTPYLHHLNGCGCHMECTGQQDHVCNCGLSDRLRAKEGTG